MAKLGKSGGEGVLQATIFNSNNARILQRRGRFGASSSVRQRHIKRKIVYDDDIVIKDVCSCYEPKKKRVKLNECTTTSYDIMTTAAGTTILQTSTFKAQFEFNVSWI